MVNKRQTRGTPVSGAKISEANNVTIDEGAETAVEKHKTKHLLGSIYKNENTSEPEK